MNLRTTDIGDSSRSELLIIRVLGVIRAWGELAMAGAVALVRIALGKDQCAEPISSPPEIAEPVAEDDELIEEVDDGR